MKKNQNNLLAKKSCTILCMIFFCLLNLNLLAQTDAQRLVIKSKTNIAALQQLSIDFGSFASQRRAIAVQWATQYGFPVDGITPDGVEFFIIDYDSINGPLYIGTNNLNASKTISTAKVLTGGTSGLNLSGSGIVLSQFDAARVCDFHPEIIGRAFQGIHETPVAAVSFHSTHVAGTMIATGVNPSSKGMAPLATVNYYHMASYDDALALEAADGTLLSNHSWGAINQGWAISGTDWYWASNPAYIEYEGFGLYTAFTKILDDIANNAPYHLQVRAAGNNNAFGPPAGTVHFHNILSTWVGGFTDFHQVNGGAGGFETTDQYGSAKNVLTVGLAGDIPSGYAAPSDVVLLARSNRGPTDDGRIKPDVVANGEVLISSSHSPSSCTLLGYNALTGTSMSCATVTGSSALLQEHYSSTHAGSFMLASTLKALIIETADESGANNGPDYHHGWGLMNTEKAAEIITKDQSALASIQELTLTNGQTLDIPITITNPTNCYFSATIVWNDPASNPPPYSLDPTTLMLVNDLDLRIIDPSSGTNFPWRLDPINPANPAIQTADNFRDNVEQVRIYNAVPGNYIIRITHKGTLASPQDFSIIINDVPTTELYIRDSPEDVGNEPNNETVAAMGVNFWSSPDIWIRQTNDGLVNQFSETIEYMASTPNYVYVRVKNKGCVPQSGNLRLYWASAGTGLGWSGDWVNNTASYPGCTAPLYGDEITPSASITVPAQSDQIYVFPWQPNDPDDYSCFVDPFHFCLLARIETSSTTPYGMTFPEVSSVWANTKDNNNIAWKNVIINDNVAGLAKPWGTVIIRNIDEKANYINLSFISRQDDIGQDLSKFKRIRLYFQSDFLKRWSEGGKLGKDVVMINDSVIEVTSPNAVMEHIFLRYNEIGSVSLSLKTIKEPTLSKDEYFNFDIVQYTENANTPQGGQTYMIKKGDSGEGCFTSSNTLSGTIIGTQTLTDSVLITGNIIVPSGANLTLNDLTVMIAENVSITVNAGGTLTLNHAQLQSACIGKKWGGIVVKSNPSAANPITILKSIFTDVANPIFIEKANNIIINSSSFIGDGSGIAISMEKVKDFQIFENTFNNYAIGIKTVKTDIANVKSLIEKNIFENVKIAVEFSQDKHQKLDVKCNRFMYSEYAILSDNTILKDQGVLGEGAGNEFISNSTLPNNKLKHTSGNSPKYYYDPTYPITTGMNITTLSSSLDRTCYVYSFDTSSTAASRVAFVNPVQESIDRKVVDVYSAPNPNSGEATIYFSLGEALQGDLIVMDIYGKIIDRIKVNAESNKVDVNYSEYANGIYLISLTNSKGEVVNKKMIISK